MKNIKSKKALKGRAVSERELYKINSADYEYYHDDYDSDDEYTKDIEHRMFISDFRNKYTFEEMY